MQKNFGRGSKINTTGNLHLTKYNCMKYCNDYSIYSSLVTIWSKTGNFLFETFWTPRLEADIVKNISVGKFSCWRGQNSQKGKLVRRKLLLHQIYLEFWALLVWRKLISPHLKESWCGDHHTSPHPMATPLNPGYRGRGWKRKFK